MGTKKSLLDGRRLWRGKKSSKREPDTTESISEVYQKKSNKYGSPHLDRPVKEIKLEKTD